MAVSEGLYSQEKDPTTGLTKNQRVVLEAMTGKDPMTQTEVAAQMGVSRQRVYQIVNDLVAKGYVIPGVKDKQ